MLQARSTCAWATRCARPGRRMAAATNPPGPPPPLSVPRQPRLHGRTWQRQHRPVVPTRAIRDLGADRSAEAPPSQAAGPGERPGTQQNGSPPAPAAGQASAAISQLQSLPELWAWAAERYGESTAIVDRHRKPHTELSFRQMHESARQFAAGLAALGVKPGERVALFAESSGRWLVADAGVMTTGAINAVRGVDSISTEELRFILEASEATAMVVQDGHTLERLLPGLPASVSLAVVLWGGVPAAPSSAAPPLNQHSVHVVGYEELMARGQEALPGWDPPPAGSVASVSGSDNDSASDSSGPSSSAAASQAQQAVAPRQALASLAFTSGTSGKPKGVMTTHHNFLSQLEDLDFLPVTPGDVAVSYLPPWHAYGRTLDYYLLSRGCKLHYSRLRDLKQDLAEQQPDVFVSVPLLLDNLHAKAMQQLHKAPEHTQLLDAALQHVRAQRVLDGTSLDHARQPPSDSQAAAAAEKAAELSPLRSKAEEALFPGLRKALGFSRVRFVVSGGGSLTPQIDDFFEAIGVTVVVGYGLTETSPVLTVRHLEGNIRGTIGPAIPRTGIRIADPQNKAAEQPDGQQGVIMAAGPQIMAGYWQNPAATDKAFPLGRDVGWFDTGDLGWRVPHGVPGSRMGGHVVITGREKDTIVLSNGENVEPQPLEDLICNSEHILFAVLIGSGYRSLGALLVPSPEAVERAGGDVESPEMRKLMQGELARALAHRAPHERVRAFAVLSEPFAIEDGTLTRTMKPRKDAIFAKYAEQVAQVQGELR